MKNMNLHSLPKKDRPRERLREVGVDNLSIQELLALVIERGRVGKNALTLAQDLLSHFGNLAKIKEATLEELQDIEGIGKATACKLKAAFKLGEKSEVKNKRYGQKIETAEDIYDLLKNELKDKKKEHIKVVSLDSRNEVIDIEGAAVGTLNGNLAHPREVFSKAIRNSAASIILVHNHPSGDPEPSQSDIKITKDMLEAGKVIGINMVDHVIIGDGEHFSFKDEEYI